jgi:hypothetical protein
MLLCKERAGSITCVWRHFDAMICRESRDIALTWWRATP